jgi:hypothetical protein
VVVRAPETRIGWLPGRIIARGNRTSTKATITTEVGILRVDNIIIKADRRYMVMTSAARFDCGAGSLNILSQRIRVNQNGEASTTSTEIDYVEQHNRNSARCVGWFTATSNRTTCSVLYSVARAAGADAVTWLMDNLRGFCLEVFECGVGPNDTGVDI